MNIIKLKNTRQEFADTMLEIGKKDTGLDMITQLSKQIKFQYQIKIKLI